MADLGSVLLIDDGELDAACAALATVDVHIDHIVGEPQTADLEPPYDLVVTNVRRAASAAQTLRALGDGEKIPWVAIHDQQEIPLRDKLRRIGVDYLVVASVAPEVLRLLFVHSLYRGPEKRESQRVPVGAAVSLECGSRSADGRLLDLTLQGCRVSGLEAEVGEEIGLRFASGLNAGRELYLRGRVVRVEGEEEDAERPVAIAFGDLTNSARSSIRAIISGQAIGTRILPLRSEAARKLPVAPAHAVPCEPTAEPVEAAPAAEPTAAPDPTERSASSPPTLEASEASEGEDELVLEDVDRRQEPRAIYQRQVTAQAGGASLVLVARDLSRQGMRIDHQEGLGVGTLLRITIYGGPGQRPAVVPARVTQDDGVAGMQLGFADMPTATRSLLDEIIAASPSIQVLRGDSTTSHLVVVDSE